MLPCGTVSVNTFSEGDIKTPFGGYKHSVTHRELKVQRHSIHIFKLRLFGSVILKKLNGVSGTRLFNKLKFNIAIGAQNIFVIEQGLKKQFIFLVCIICSISDLILIFAGIFYFITLINFY